MEPAIKKQKTTHEDDIYYGDRLTALRYNQELHRAIPGLSADESACIIKLLNFRDLSSLSGVNNTFKKISYHHFAIKRAEIYKHIFTPLDWNIRTVAFEKLNYEIRKRAFRNLPPYIDPKKNAVAFARKGLSINNFSKVLSEKFSQYSGGYKFLDDKIQKMFGKDILTDYMWISIPRNYSVENSTTKEISYVFKHIICVFTEWLKFKKELNFTLSASYNVGSYFLHQTNVRASVEMDATGLRAMELHYL
jgi:hypothetical protein